MRTILQALKDEIAYPLSDGFLENKLMARELESQCEICAETFNSNQFKGAIADCLYALIESPNFSESDISISIPDRNLILKKANSYYRIIGEDEKQLDMPNVYIGWN